MWALCSTAPRPLADADAALAEATNAGELARRLDGIAVLAEVPFHSGPETADGGDVLDGIDWSRRALLPRSESRPVLKGEASEEIEQP